MKCHFAFKMKQLFCKKETRPLSCLTQSCESRQADEWER